MRRFIAVFLTAVLLLSLCACTKASESSDSIVGVWNSIVGVWKYSYNEEYREMITDAITDPGVYVDLYYEFYADGTGKTYLSTDKDPMEFSYTYDGETLTITNSTGSFDTPATLKGNVLSVFAGNNEWWDLKRQ